MLALQYAANYPQRVKKIFLTAAVGINAEGYVLFQKELIRKIPWVDKWKLFMLDRKIKKGKASFDDGIKLNKPLQCFLFRSIKNIPPSIIK